MTIKEYLQRIGASQQELTAKVVSRMERAMLCDTDLTEMKADTVLDILANASEALGNEKSNLKVTINQAKDEGSALARAVKEAEKQLSDLKAQTAGIKDAKINSPETRDAVMAYAATLNATKEIFGNDNLTPEVMIAAINAGSYIAWRGIMGPKDGADKAYRRVF